MKRAMKVRANEGRGWYGARENRCGHCGRRLSSGVSLYALRGEGRCGMCAREAKA